MNRRIRALSALLLALCLLISSAFAEGGLGIPLPKRAAPVPQTAEAAEAGETAYTLDRVVVLSRHNIRSPLSGGGSVLGDITPHTWFAWTSQPSELSLRGAILETELGQYFRLWLESEGFFPENYQPETGAVRFYANAKQRTIATARYFSAGLLPVAQQPIEVHAPYDTMDPVFSPEIRLVTEDFIHDALAQIAEKGGEEGLDGILASQEEAITLLMDVLDLEQSAANQAGTCTDLRTGETTVRLEVGKEPGLVSPLRTATQAADALTLQYYEEPDAAKAAFGHDLTDEDWRLVHGIVDTYSDVLFGMPMISVQVANPLLRELRAELTAEGRRFTFLCGHDSNLTSVLTALGAEEYLLSDTVEQHTPIGSKLCFERWIDGAGEAWYRVRMIYQSTAQLRAMTPLSLEQPPVSYPMRFTGVHVNGDDMMPEAELLTLFDRAIEAYDEQLRQYGVEDVRDAA